MAAKDELPDAPDEHQEDLAFTEIHGSIAWEKELRALLEAGDLAGARARLAELEAAGVRGPTFERWRLNLAPTEAQVGGEAAGDPHEAARRELVRRTDEFRGKWVLLGGKTLVDADASRSVLLARYRGRLEGLALSYVPKAS